MVFVNCCNSKRCSFIVYVTEQILLHYDCTFCADAANDATATSR